MTRKIKVVHSPTKPGPGWIQVTPEIVARLEARSEAIRKNGIFLQKELDKLRAEGVDVDNIVARARARAAMITEATEESNGQP